MTLDDLLKQRLAKIRQADRFRSMQPVGSPQGAYVRVDGRELMNLCSNDYLGLANDRRLRTAAARALETWGTGSGASRLLSGNLEIHRQLEREAASLVGKDMALSFGSGYAANVGLISALAGQSDAIFSDRLNHASLIDGCRLSRAKTYIYEHTDPEDLERLLTIHRDRFETALILTEGAFSMDGDLAPLPELADLARRHKAALIVDEAHAIGVFGQGRGVCFAQSVTDQVFAIVGTCGKALGSQGAFVAGSDLLRQYLVNAARSFVFSTAPAPVSAAASLEAIRILGDEGPTLCTFLAQKAELLRSQLVQAGLPVMEKSAGPIVPVVFGGELQVLEIEKQLKEQGILARAIRPPTVPPGSSRIRFSVTVGHRKCDLERVGETLARIGVKKRV